MAEARRAGVAGDSTKRRPANWRRGCTVTGGHWTYKIVRVAQRPPVTIRFSMRSGSGGLPFEHSSHGLLVSNLSAGEICPAMPDQLRSIAGPAAEFPTPLDRRPHPTVLPPDPASRPRVWREWVEYAGGFGCGDEFFSWGMMGSGVKGSYRPHRGRSSL